LENVEISEKLNKLLEMQETILKLSEQVSEQMKTISEQAQAIADRDETIAYLKKMIFGSKSEKSKNFDIPGQLSLFGEQDITPEDREEKGEVSGYTRTKQRKDKTTHAEMYKNLPVKKRVIPATGEERICEYCGNEMEHLGEKFVRDEIEITPAKVVHVKVYQETVVCKQCKNDGAAVIHGAAVPAPLIEHSPVTPSTAAYAIYMKYVNSIPLYRQEKEWLQMGCKIPRVTLANWVITCADKYFAPIYDRLHLHLLERLVVCADETPCQVLKEKGKTPQSKSYMWLYCTAEDGMPAIALYEYQPGRHGINAYNFLKGFKGKYVVCDGYQGYNRLPEGVTRCGCLAHVRRKWADAIPAERRKRPPGDKMIPAEKGFEYCNRLFEEERKFRESTDPDEKKEIRIKEEPAIWKEFWEWLDTVNASDGSRLGRAVNYTKNQRPNLENYLQDEAIPISNNFAENCARPYAVGRKNFLFHNSTDGAKTSAMIYSLVECAKRNNLNVLQYLTQVLSMMRGYKDEPELIEDMMPWSDLMQQSCGVNKEAREDS
jgi:transposase